MGPLFRLSLHQVGGLRRLLLILLLASFPVGLAILVHALASDDQGYEKGFTNHLIDAMLIAGVMPIVAMILATTTFGDELEDHTLSYLVLKPIPRWLIVLPKFLASIVVAGPLLVASGVIATVVGLEGGGQAALAIGVAVFTGVVAYTAIFTWAGLITSRALAFALIYVFLWEGLISTFLGGIRYLSVRGYTLTILHGIDEDSFYGLSDRVIEFPAAIAGAATVTVLFFLLTVRRLRRMDVP